jgi:tRNA A37 N6-isopentenylltransferase MiaA
MIPAPHGSDPHRRKNVSSSPTSLPTGPIALPLSTELRSAYKELHDAIEEAIETSRDAAVLEALNACQAEVDNVLTKDDMYRLHQNTELFNALCRQINDTNEGLEELKERISSIAAGFSEAGQVLAAINKVLTLLPGII